MWSFFSYLEYNGIAEQNEKNGRNRIDRNNYINYFCTSDKTKITCIANVASAFSNWEWHCSTVLQFILDLKDSKKNGLQQQLQQQQQQQYKQ